MDNYCKIIPVDISKGLVRMYVGELLATNDKLAHRFGADLTNDGQDVDTTGMTVNGYFIRPDGNTVVLNGTASGSQVYVDLPESCYVYDGSFTLAVKASDTTHRETLLVLDGRIISSRTGDIIDPGEVVPDLEDLLEQIAACEAATDAANDAADAANTAAEAVDQRIVPLENMTPTEIAYTYGQNGRGVYYTRNETINSSISRIVGPVDVSAYDRLYYSRRKNSNSGSNAGMHFLDANGAYISGERDIVGGVSENAYEML